MNLQVVAFSSALMLATSLPAIAAPACEAHSGLNTAVLIELYTSEGCSSCPPADRQLNQLATTLEPSAAVVPVALHVDYWDQLGWKDRFAQPRFTQRQAWLVHANDRRVVYTPQFFVAGSEFRSSAGVLRDTVRQLNTKPATAKISLRGALSRVDVLTLDVQAATHAGDDVTSLYLGIAENDLMSQVKGGENQGTTLAHNHVVREWFGPFRLQNGTVLARREITLPSAWRRDRLEIVAFVQDEHSGAVLQALRAEHCAGI